MTEDRKTLQAGAGTCAIDFGEEMLPTDGFCGIHDAPCARVLLLSGMARLALVTVELVNIPDDIVLKCRESVAELTGIPQEQVWLHMTHAISTPHLPGGVMPWTEPDPRGEEKAALFRRAVYEAVAGAAKTALSSLKEAKTGFGTGYCNLNANRDVETPFGWWVGPPSDGPSNHMMTVLRIDDLEDKPIARFIWYGLKACAIDLAGAYRGERVISSDIPGEACRLLEARYGVPVLFCTSAAGDQIPVEQAVRECVDDCGKTYTEDLGVSKGLEIVARLGKKMAETADYIMEGTACTDPEPEMQMTQFRFRWPGKARSEIVLQKKAAYKEDGERTVCVSAAQVGPAAMVAVTPEINYETERQLQEQSPFPYTLVMSMTNGVMKYMPERSAYERTTWEAQSSMLMPGAAERFVELAAGILQEFQPEYKRRENE